MNIDLSYDEQHSVSFILEEIKSALCCSKPPDPIQYMVDFLLLLQSRSMETQFNHETRKDILQEIRLELQDESSSLELPSLSTFSNSPASTNLRKRFRPTLESLDSEQELPLKKIESAFSSTSIPTFPSAPQPPVYSRARRGSVSAESIQPSDSIIPTQVFPKTPEAKMRIALATSQNLLFRNLEAEQKRCIVDAMFEKTVKAGEIVIRQGDEGDNFYVVDQGIFDIYVNEAKVVEVKEGGSFGELALMYNTPRAATVKAVSDGVLWAVDRVTFRGIITSNTYRKRRMYETFLKTVPLLSSLETSEITKISDALEPINFEAEDIIIEQGTIGEYFYLIESGEVRVIQTTSEQKIELPGLQKGDYFGELAFLNDAPRVATVMAKTPVKLVALSKAAFVRLLGPVVDILKRNVSKYSNSGGTIISDPIME